VKRFPRVTWHKKATECTALTSSRGSCKMYFHKNDDVRAAAQAKAKCKNVAHWRFRSLKGSWAEDGDYCWSHLIHFGLYGDMVEEAATDRWMEAHAPRRPGADQAVPETEEA